MKARRHPSRTGNAGFQSLAEFVNAVEKSGILKERGIGSPEGLLPPSFTRVLWAPDVLGLEKLSQFSNTPAIPSAGDEVEMQNSLAQFQRDLLEQRDFIGYMSTFPSDALCEHLLLVVATGRMTPKEYWPLVRATWERAEVIAPNLAGWKKLLQARRPRRELMMTVKERLYLAALPNEFLVYRGCLMSTGSEGISWTLSKRKAEFFARYSLGQRSASVVDTEFLVGKPAVIRGSCKKRDVIAYLNGRKHQEILILPSKVHRP